MIQAAPLCATPELVNDPSAYPVWAYVDTTDSPERYTSTGIRPDLLG